MGGSVQFHTVLCIAQITKAKFGAVLVYVSFLPLSHLYPSFDFWGLLLSLPPSL